MKQIQSTIFTFILFFLSWSCSQASLSDNMSLLEGQDICKTYESFSKLGLPEKPLKQLFYYYSQNRSTVNNPRYLSFADYSQRSTKKRFYLLDLQTLTVERFKVSHGSGKINGVSYGDPEHNGYLKRCIHNRKVHTKAGRHPRYAMTRPGFFMTDAPYLSGGSHLAVRNDSGVLVRGWPYLTEEQDYNGMRLIGLSAGINDRALTDGVVMHGAWYNDKRNTKRDVMGRSFGCPAFHPDEAGKILNRIQMGSLFYSYAPQCKSDAEKIEAELFGIESFCQ